MAPRQLSLLNDCGLNTVVHDVKAALHSAQRVSGGSREQLLDLVNARAKREGIKLSGNGGLSKDMLDKWLNPEDESRVPGLAAIDLLCAVLDTVEPLNAMARPLGAMVIYGKDITLLKLARAREEQKALRKQMRKLEEELG